jgi:hypothetical protein
MKSKAVAVASNTTGWEAFLCGKPVIVFGNPFYDFFPSVRKVVDLNELPVIIREAIFNHKPLPDDRLLKIIHSVFAATYPGEIDWSLPEAYSSQNIRNLADGIVQELCQN